MSVDDDDFVNSFASRVLSAVQDDLSILLECTKLLRVNHPEKAQEDIYLLTVEDERTGILAKPKFSSSIFSMELPDTLGQGTGTGTVKFSIYQYMKFSPQSSSREILVIYLHRGQLLIGYVDCPELSLLMYPYKSIQAISIT